MKIFAQRCRNQPCSSLSTGEAWIKEGSKGGSRLFYGTMSLLQQNSSMSFILAGCYMINERVPVQQSIIYHNAIV